MMFPQSPRSMLPLLLGAVVLLGAGAGGMYLYLGGRHAEPGPARSAAGLNAAALPVPDGDQLVTVPVEMLERAGIETVSAGRGATAGFLRIPATIQPHGYRQVTVRSTAPGRVLSVAAELGQQIRRGDAAVELHVPEIAETERAYIATTADLKFARQQLDRLQRLVTIGAASQQELDEVRARESTLLADLEGARARLLLLGRTAGQIEALAGGATISPVVSIAAPMAGTVTARPVNPGQTVDGSEELLTIVDLSLVWVVGEVFERDLAQVRVGSKVTMTTAALPGEVLTGDVTYVDPQVAPESRTARVRAEIANPGGRLRLGMLMDMRVSASSRDAVMVPRSAVQTIGGVDVVYVAQPRRTGAFAERSVRLGPSAGDHVEVLTGLREGESVVTKGSFLVRAERERGSLAPPRPAPAILADTPVRQAPEAAPAAGAHVVDLAVDASGFTPARVSVPANTPIRLRITRTVEETCATEVLIPSLKVTRPLPVGRAVVIDLPAQPAGTLEFMCGMKMLKGALVIK
jgi:cobalt-zinc-cadmium efflux system membrane fusion protein